MNLNLNFGAKNKSEKWVRILARFFQVIVNYASAKFDQKFGILLCFQEMTFMAQIVYLINKVIKGIHIDYLTPSVNVLHPCTTLHSLYVSIFLPKGHSFCKQCLHDLQFTKTRSSSPNLSKLTRAVSCHFMKTRFLCRIV